VIGFALPRQAEVRLAVYDVGGRELAVLAEGPYDAGEHIMRWNGRNAAGRALSPGIYLVRMSAADFEAAVKVVMIR
jgi:hypothetical protein